MYRFFGSQKFPHKNAFPPFDGDKARVLFANSVPAFANSAQLESFLGTVLATRDYSVAFAFCDGALPACLNSKYGSEKSVDQLISGAWKKKPKGCARCEKNLVQYFPSHARQFFFSEHCENEDQEDIFRQIAEGTAPDRWIYRGIPIEEHAFAATARFFAKGRPQEEPQFEAVLKRYAEASVKSITFYDEILGIFDPAVICMHHGIYVPQGLAVEVAKMRNMRVVTWTPSYRKGTFLFAEGDSYHKVMPAQEMPPGKLTETQSKKILRYLDSRQHGTNDWIWFNDEKKRDTSFRSRFAIGEDKKIISAFSNVFWDAQLHFNDAIFEDMIDWLEDTINFFSKQSDAHLIIRAHPAEHSGFIPSRQPLEEVLSEKLANCENVSLIPGSSNENSYALAEEAAFSIVYGSKIAGELAALGSRVIVAGEAWAKNKGFTFDLKNRKDYWGLLRHHLDREGRLDEHRRDLALKYCHDLFFSKMIEMEYAVPTGNKNHPFFISYRHWKDLRHMKYPGLEKILSLIIRPSPPNDARGLRQNIAKHSKTGSVELATCALMNKKQTAEATCIVEGLGLSSHHDPQKNWDTLKMLTSIVQEHKNPPIVLDAGSGKGSVILQWLRAAYPSANLYACDRTDKSKEVFDKFDINFSVQEMSETDFPDAFFDAVTSISVIEHGVDTDKFFKETGRILKPSGKLYISTDYWQDKLDTSNKFPYGKEYGPMKVFSMDEMLEIIEQAKAHGLDLIGDPAKLTCDEKAIYWDRMDESYTFAYVPFVKI